MNLRQSWYRGVIAAFTGALSLSAGSSQAILTYNIFEDGGNLVIQTSGSLILPDVPDGSNACGALGALDSAQAIICMGGIALGEVQNGYAINGPTSFTGTASLLDFTAGFSGTKNSLVGASPTLGFRIDSLYTSGSPIVSRVTFSGQTLAGIGLTGTEGTIGTWSLVSTGDAINVVVGAPPSAAVPGPLPVFGAAAAFGWSRRLRRRSRPVSEGSPQA